MKISVLAIAVALVHAAPATAQDRAAFTGAYAGIGAGYVEHHFAVEFERSVDGVAVERFDEYRRSHGVGVGAFIGHDWAISPRGRIGVEVEATTGGDTVRLGNSPLGASAGDYAQKPRWGIKGTVRAGYAVSDRLLGYALAGYGGNRYRIRDGVGLGDGNGWGSSFVVGAGAEYRLTDRVGLRLDGKHVDNQTWQLLVGIPVRF